MTLAKSSRRAQALSQQTFESFVKERPKVIVRLGPGSSPGFFLSGIIDHFAADLGDGVAFGAFDTLTLLYAPWPLKFVGTIWAVPPPSAPDGYYLFVDGKARAFHPGTVGDAGRALSTVGVAALISIIFESSKPLGVATKAVNDTYAKEVIAFFEQFLTPPPVQQAPFDWSKFVEGIKPKREDPYATLGITALATREEVQKAYKERVASVHPDKVATLAPELQKFAHDLFVRVQAAYDEIKLIRGWQ